MAKAASGTVRALRANDLDAVVEIDRLVTGRTRRGFYEKRLESAIAHPDSFVAVCAEADGKVVGFALNRIQSGEFGDAGKAGILDAIGIDPAYQGKGQARALMQGLQAALKKKGVGVLRTQADWTEGDLIRFFAASGFELAPRQVLSRAAVDDSRGPGDDIAEERMDADIPDHSDPGGDDFAALSRDKVPCRSMVAADLDQIIRIDSKLTGSQRTDYYKRKMDEVLNESGIRVSLVAEVDGLPAGYMMARVDYGEFGRAEPAAVIDTLGVHPAHAGRGVAQALLSQLLGNLASLQVETIRTTVTWNNFGLLSWLNKNGFAPSQRLVLSRTVE